MDQPLKETPKEVYADPTLQKRARLAEVTEGGAISTTGTFRS